MEIDSSIIVHEKKMPPKRTTPSYPNVEQRLPTSDALPLDIPPVRGDCCPMQRPLEVVCCPCND